MTGIIEKFPSLISPEDLKEGNFTGDPPDKPDDDRNTLLHFACQKGFLTLVKKLVPLFRGKYKFFEPNLKQQTPLYLACIKPHGGPRMETIVDLLLDNGHPINNTVESDGPILINNNILHTACSRSSTEIVKKLIKKISNATEGGEALIIAQNARGSNALHIMCYKYCDLKDSGWAGDKYLRSILAVITMLIEIRPATIQTKDTDGITPLSIVIKHGNSLDLSTILLNYVPAGEQEAARQQAAMKNKSVVELCFSP